MGKPANLKNEVSAKPKQKAQPARWPFDPMSDPLQPGDHEPVRIPEQVPEEARRVQKQTGAGKRTKKEKGGRR